VAPNSETSLGVPLGHQMSHPNQLSNFTTQLGGLVKRRDLAYWLYISWRYCVLHFKNAKKWEEIENVWRKSFIWPLNEFPYAKLVPYAKSVCL